jgi:hypothetical protein
VLYLQSILEQLVHLGHLRRDRQVNSAVGNLDNDSATDLGVDLGDDLELLASGNVVGLVDSGFETAESSVVEGLLYVSNGSNLVSDMFSGLRPANALGRTYCSAGDGQLNLPSVRTHEHAKLLYNAL